jgi:YD repeat-containing protein
MKKNSLSRHLIKISAAIFACISYSLCLAQIKAPQITPLSPNSAALFKYAEFPVNMYTGIPSISIPIYEVKSGSLKVPISLSYHAGGFRYEEQASWTGLGWTLQTGGAVSRNVKGVADEKLEGMFSKTGPLNLNIQQCDVQIFQDILNRYTDYQPDEFSFSVPGKSGRFIYPQGASQPITIPYEPVKISKPSGTNLSYFDLTDEGGTKYRFGTTESTYGGTGAYTEDVNPMPTSWLLNKIETPDLSRNVIFNYVPGEGDVQKNSIQHRVDVIDQVGAPEGWGCTSPSPSIGFPVQTNLSYHTNTQYLSQILFENGKVEFVQSASYRSDIFEKQRSLEFIKIYALQGTTYTLVRTIKFVYSYFKKFRNAVLVDWKLKLDKVQVLGSDNVQVEEYNFDYQSSTFSGDLSNPNDFYSQDYWGFFNGATSNTNLIPRQAIYFTESNNTRVEYIGGGLNRETNSSLATEGVLKKITYPTGGSTEFEFESHQYDGGGQNKYAGGLRVKKISSRPSLTESALVKTYRYGLTGDGNGQRMFYNTLGYFMSAVDNVSNIANSGCYYYQRSYSSVSSMQIDGQEGTPVVYPYVTEYLGTEVINNGRTEYVYDNGRSPSDGIYPLYYQTNNLFQRQTNHWDRGQLTSKNVYTSGNILVSTTRNSYQRLNLTDVPIGIMVAKKYNIYNELALQCYVTAHGMTTLPIYAYGYYTIKTGAVRPLTATETVYDAGGSGNGFTTEITYTFDGSFLQPIQTEKVLKRGTNGYEERLVSYGKFPFDYAFSGTPSGNEALGIKFLQDKNIFNVPVEQYQVRKIMNGGITSSSVISGTLTTYKSNLPYPDKLWQLDVTSPVTVSSFGSGSSIMANMFVKNTAYKAKINFDLYDASGKLLQLHKEDDQPVSYVWGYHNSVYPVAEVLGVPQGSISYNQSIITNPSSDQALQTELNTIRQQFPSALIKTYSYRPLTGVTSETDVNGKSVYYQYDGFGRLQLIKDNDGNVLKTFEYRYKQ